MARGRMLSKDISIDKDVNKLSLKATLLYTWIIPHLDCAGRFYATPTIVKGHIVPYREDFPTEEIKPLLKEMEKNDLIRIYGDDDEFLVAKGFKNHNKPHPHEPDSKIPEYECKKKS